MIGSAVLMSSAGFKFLSLQLVVKIIRRSLSKDPQVIAENLVQLLSPPDLPLIRFMLISLN